MNERKREGKTETFSSEKKEKATKEQRRSDEEQRRSKDESKRATKKHTHTHTHTHTHEPVGTKVGAKRRTEDAKGKYLSTNSADANIHKNICVQMYTCRYKNPCMKIANHITHMQI